MAGAGRHIFRPNQVWPNRLFSRALSRSAPTVRSR
jgi:hypothetical protein